MAFFSRVKFSEEELTDLMYAWLAVSFAFAVVLSGGLARGFVGWNTAFFQNFLVAAIAVGTGFLLHELAHKLVAQKYGCWAEFRKWDFGLILAVGMSFLGFVFAAPGAVMISGLISQEQNGRISAIGPVANLVLASSFFVIGLLLSALTVTPSPLLVKIISYGFFINAWLALFNMLPIPPLDGSKVMAWSTPVWLAITAAAGFMVFFV